MGWFRNLKFLNYYIRNNIWIWKGAGNSLSDDCNVMRFCRVKDYDNERVLATAFDPTPKEDCVKNGPSVHCLNYLNGETDEEKLDHLRDVSRLNRKKSHRFAEFSVRDMTAVAESVMTKSGVLMVTHKPLRATDKYIEDWSHSEIIAPLRDDARGLRLREELAETALRLHQAVADN